MTARVCAKRAFFLLFFCRPRSRTRNPTLFLPIALSHPWQLPVARSPALITALQGVQYHRCTLRPAVLARVTRRWCGTMAPALRTLAAAAAVAALFALVAAQEVEDHTFRPPFQDFDNNFGTRKLAKWMIGGSAVLNENFLRLTPDRAVRRVPRRGKRVTLVPPRVLAPQLASAWLHTRVLAIVDHASPPGRVVAPLALLWVWRRPC